MHTRPAPRQRRDLAPAPRGAAANAGATLASFRHSPRALAERAQIAGSFGGPGGAKAPIQRKYLLPEDQAAAIAQLRARYPQITLSPHSKGYETMDAFWEKHVAAGGRADGALASAIDRMLGDVLDDKERTGKISVLVVGSAEQVNLVVDVAEVMVVNQILQAEGGKLKVKIESVTAKGRGKRLFARGLLPLYQSLGVRKLELDASSIGSKDDGRYAWARYGFLPGEADWNTMRQAGRERVKKGYFLFPDALDKKMLGILESPSPRALRELILLSWQEGDRVTRILNGMLVVLKSWKGTLDLEDERDRRWIEMYTGEEDKARLRELIPAFQKLAGP